MTPWTSRSWRLCELPLPSIPRRRNLERERSCRITYQPLFNKLHRSAGKFAILSFSLRRVDASDQSSRCDPRTLAGAAFILSFASQALGLIHPRFLVYHAPLVWKLSRPELWRPLTSFFLTSPQLVCRSYIQEFSHGHALTQALGNNYGYIFSWVDTIKFEYESSENLRAS